MTVLFQPSMENRIMFKITLQRLPATIEFEAGSISEINGILQQEDTELRKFISIAAGLDDGSGQEGTQEAVPGEVTPKESKRTRGPNKNKPAAEATAPAPMPVPDAPATTTTVLPPNELPGADAPALADDGIPEALRRVPAPPALVAPPPPPPAAPPSGILAGKIIAELDTRKATTADNGKSLAEWLGACNVVTPGVTYDAAIAAVRMTTDDRLKPIADVLFPVAA